MTPSELKRFIGSRKTYVWGARHDGYAASLVMKRMGITISSFIDSSVSLKGTYALGIPVILPEDFFRNNIPSNSFVVIASGFYADEISESCLNFGFKKLHDFVVYGELKYFNYQVDISGTCNLKCISCPRGNYPDHRPPGFMSAATYSKVLEKILKEDPYTGIITLYNWGEPLLNKELADIIHITNKHSCLSAISSNLCLKKDFKEVIKAKPTWFRVSASGWGKNYEKTHTGGKWDLFLANLYLLKEYKDSYHPDLLVEVFFHIYSHNRDDFPKMQALCNELGFTIRYRHAALAPLDNIEAIIENRPVTEEANLTRTFQRLKVEEAMEIARREKKRPCYYENHLWINWDLQIPQCMEWYSPHFNLVEKAFLSVSVKELLDARQKSNFCKICKSKGLHRCYCVYGDEKLIYKKNSLSSYERVSA